MIQFPYGIADFQSIRRQGMFYLDRTSGIREIERLGPTLVFLRPRRFGKSLWLQTLASYYDLRLADDFEILFGDLDIGRQPTAERNSFFVLQWNFSEVSARGSIEVIAGRLHDYLNQRIEDFLVTYEDHLTGPVKIESDATGTLRHLLTRIRRQSSKLCLLIDEYDNFVNEVMVQDALTYKALFEGEGPFKEIFKSVKSGTEGQGLERVFVTGVSPVALNDLTSGFNSAVDVSHEPELATLCGFLEKEIRDAVDLLARGPDLAESSEELVATMRTWYNGYRFSTEAEDLVYNPTNTLYFLKHLAFRGKPPEELQDKNLRTDRAKLTFLAGTNAGSKVIERLTEGDGSLEIPRLETTFSLEDLMTQIGEDQDAVASLLYYMGMLTRTRDTPPRLRIPNLVVRKLFLDRLLELSLQEPGGGSLARRAAMTFFKNGDVSPLLQFFEQNLLPVLSNRDRGAAHPKPGHIGSGVNEMVIKTLFLSILFDDSRYAVFSELELDHRYADLCLLVRNEMRQHGFFDLLFEFKLVRRKKLGKAGTELRQMAEQELRQLPVVATAFQSGREQVLCYRDALTRKFGEALPRCYVVVAVGLERVLGEEVKR